MPTDDYEFDHAPSKPLRWYHLPILGPLLLVGKLIDLSRDARCKMFGHRPVYGQINYGHCDRCNRALSDYPDEPSVFTGPPGRYKGRSKD